MFYYHYYWFSLVAGSGNQCLVLFAIATNNNIKGTSVKTPTVVAKAAGEFIPNSATATATANSKKFDAPINPAGAEILKGNFNILHAR